jgi:hypothetical protein
MRDRYPSPPNPFTGAFDEVGRAIDSAFKSVPPPPNVTRAIQEFDRRMADPDAWAEWMAIFKRKGGTEGIRKYIDDMEKLKGTWGV